MSKLILMGSGETAPSLVSLHRRLLQGVPQARACWFDTPYGFQENVDILSQKTVDFFAANFSLPLALVRFPAKDIPESNRQAAYCTAQASNYLFSGPGSPSYALSQWIDSAFPALFLSKLSPTENNVVLFASATACTIGRYCLPVYEIYKVGQKPHWLEGLDLLGALGFNALVLPHFNNTVGGNHDTRFCYLGENRLKQLEAMLDPATWIWGVDEHTALVIDLTSSRFEVYGKGGVTLRRQGQSIFWASGYQGALAQLQDPKANELRVEQAISTVLPVRAAASGLVSDLAHRREAAFLEALEAGSGKLAVAELIALEELLEEWSADTDQHSRQLARSSFRGMLERLGLAAECGLKDPKEAIAPWVELLLSVRTLARGQRQFSLADEVRDGLFKLGVEVRDEASGATSWSLKDGEELPVEDDYNP